MWTAFTTNHNFVKAHNARVAKQASGPRVVLSMNGPHAGMSHQEFLARRRGVSLDNGVRPRKSKRFAMETSEITEEMQASIPASFDWRQKGKVTPVQEQLACGACWAFTATAVLESAYAIKKGISPIKLSEQHMLDCAGRTLGCSDGKIINAWFWVMINRGMAKASAYSPYIARKGECTKVPDSAKSGQMTQFKELRPNENEIKYFVATDSPVAIVVDISNQAWQLYQSGVISQKECNTGLFYPHAVTIVGYTTVQDTPVWIIKNSWGTKWGMKGYGYLERTACKASDYPRAVVIA